MGEGLDRDAIDPGLGHLGPGTIQPCAAHPAIVGWPGAAAAIFNALADANCNVDTIIQNEPRTEGVDAEVSFTIGTEDLRAAEQALAPIRAELELARVDTDTEIGKVSIVGAGMRSHPGVAAKVFQTLADENINIEMISTSPIKISCVIRQDDVPSAVRALHAAFDLGAEAIELEQGPR